MKKLLIFLLFSIFFLNSCKKDSSNPVNTNTAPSTPTLLSPADTATGVAVPTTFSWNAIANADSFTLQVSLSSSLNNPVFNKSGLTIPSQEVTGLSNLTVYYWRVRATNKYGISDWSNTRSFTTTGPLPGIPTLSSPANNSTNVVIVPTLHWNTSTGATSYTIQLSNNSSFTSFAYNQSGLVGTSQQVSGLSIGVQYYWRVNATNKYGTSGWSNTYTFTTLDLSPVIPNLLVPANNSIVGIPLTLSWIPDSKGLDSSYTLQVSTNSSFTSFAYNQSGLVGSSQYLSGLSIGTQYYWRVCATNSYGTSGWSNIWSFTTSGVSPVIPVLLSPNDASSGIAVIPSLSWNASNGAASYTLQVAANSSFSTFVYNQSGLTNTTQQVSSLNPLTIYYWRVSATNTAGTSGWSTVWSFTTTGPSPDAPVLSSPLNGTTTNSSPLSLIWIASGGATSYKLQVSVDSLFTSFVYNQSGLTTSSQQLTGLTASTYYWRVAATNNNGTSGWSKVWNITTLAPTTPALSSPINGATAQSVSPVLRWSASGGATSYTLQVSVNSSFTSFVYNQSGLTSLNQQVTGLTAQTKYYWRVSASNDYGTSGWTNIWSFTTQ